jgi:hypothetical protein
MKTKTELIEDVKVQKMFLIPLLKEKKLILLNHYKFQKTYNIKQKVLTTVLVLDRYYKRVPEYVFIDNIGNKEKDIDFKFKNGSVFLPKNKEKLIKNCVKTKKYDDLYTLMILSKNHTEQYKYLDADNVSMCEKTRHRTLNFDVIYIDFIKSLRGKDIKDLISYFSLN